MADAEQTAPPLTPGAKRLVETAANKQTVTGQPPCVHHWLMALMERHGPMAEAMAEGLEAKSLREYLRKQVAEGNVGAPLDQETVVGKAVERAKGRALAVASERDLVAVILTAAGYTLVPDSAATTRTGVPAATTEPVVASPAGETATPPAQGGAGGETRSAQGSAGGGTAAMATGGAGSGAALQSGAATAAKPAPAAGWQPRAKRPTPTLEHFGRDVTREALAGKLMPFVGREEEVRLVVETLCRRTKRNPVLVGPAGVGKTAIVEGLAQRIVRGEVPEMLRGARVLALQPSTLIAGAGYGDLEKRMEAVVKEAGQDGLLLFIDEVHTIVGAGGPAGVGDMASLLKPPLARGEIACIAATTDDEYRRFIESDAALERRFQPLRVQELSAEQTLEILHGLSADLGKARGVTVPEEILDQLVTFADRYMRNRHFPDKAVDLLEQCVAHALAEGKTTVEPGDAETVVQRLVGMPLSLETRLDGLRARLEERGLLGVEETNALLNRLRVTLAGFDLHPTRPNLVALLVGEAAANGQALAATLAETLYGGAGRIVAIDFSRFTEHHHVSMLIGSPPGYIGYSENLPIHQIAQMPWCVLLCANIHACHPYVREVLQQALASGSLTDATGRRIYLSDTVVVLTAGLDAEGHRKMGILSHEENHAEKAQTAAEQELGADFVDQCDLICIGAGRSDADRPDHLRQSLLADLSERYSKQGLYLQWDDTLVAWLAAHQSAHPHPRDWERLVDDQLVPVLLTYLATENAHAPQWLTVHVEDNAVKVREKEGGGENEKMKDEG